jgi:hypothetical protein
MFEPQAQTGSPIFAKDKKSISGIGVNAYKYIKLNLQSFLETGLKILIMIEILKKTHKTVRS